MRTLVLILLLSIPAGIFAQDWFILTGADSANLRKFRIEWYKGIDPVKINTGEWVLPDRVIDIIPANVIVRDKAEKIVTSDLKIYLNGKEKRPLTIDDFPASELQAMELKETIPR